MIVLKPIATAQEISVYIRNEATVYTLEITNEETQDTISSTITGTYADGKFTFDIAYSFTEARFYFIRLFDENGKELNKTKIFITEQSDDEKYLMNDLYYKTISKNGKTFIVK